MTKNKEKYFQQLRSLHFLLHSNIRQKIELTLCNNKLSGRTIERNHVAQRHHRTAPIQPSVRRMEVSAHIKNGAVLLRIINAFVVRLPNLQRGVRDGFAAYISDLRSDRFKGQEFEMRKHLIRTRKIRENSAKAAALVKEMTIIFKGASLEYGDIWHALDTYISDLKYVYAKHMG